MKKRKKPDFKRQEWWKRKKLRLCWRKPKGLDSKLGQGIRSYGARVKVGYGSPSEIKGKNWLGLEEVRVFNASELASLDPKRHIVRVASSVGKKKRAEIAKVAEEKGIKIVNKLRI
ncbi:MAG: 50S ribosomal protein L32e [Candidatus Aenigmatarchaeota archaeon]